MTGIYIYVVELEILDLQMAVATELVDVLCAYADRSLSILQKIDDVFAPYEGYNQQIRQWCGEQQVFLAEQARLRDDAQKAALEAERAALGLDLVTVMKDNARLQKIVQTLRDANPVVPYVTLTSVGDPNLPAVAQFLRDHFVPITTELMAHRERSCMMDLASALAKLERGRHEDELVKTKPA